MSRHVYEFGSFRIDSTDRLLLHDGDPVPLPPKVIDTLLILLEQAGHVVEKDELIKRVWPDTFVEEASLTQNISTLRRALGDTGDAHVFVETIPKRGYRFMAAVRVGAEPAEPRAAPSRRLALITLLVAAALVIGGEAFRRSRQIEPAPAAPAAMRTIAVLPFALIGGSDDEYLGLGMTDVLITKLANIRQITVRPTSAVRRFTATRGAMVDPLAAARQLGVDSVLEGSIHRSGDRIRVTVQLVRVAGGMPLWTGTFDEQFTDIFAVEDSISEQVVKALAVQMTSGERRRISRRDTENVEAYQEYLKGRFHWNKRTEEGLKKAAEHFRAAINKDPVYALAYAGLADCYNLFNNYDLYPATESGPKAKAAALKALELDDGLAEAHTSLALVQEVFDFDQVAADRSYRHAIELNPNYSTAHHWFGLFLVQMGETDEALRQLARAHEIDPLSLIIEVGVAWAHYFARRYERAVEVARQTIELEPAFWPAHLVLGWALEQTHDFEGARTAFEQAIKLSGENTLAVASLGHLHAVTGNRPAAEAVLGKLEKRARKRYVSPYFPAAIFTALGERERAFQWLERAHRERAYWLISIHVNPWFDPIRSDPRFQDLERRIGFAKFAETRANDLYHAAK